MIEPTDEMMAAFADAKAAVKGCPGLDDGDEQGLAAVLAIAERDQAPTQDAYDTTVRALEKHRARADEAEARLAGAIGLCCIGYAPCQGRPGCWAATS